MSKRSVIITAGGIGKRMNSEIPKQFHLVNGQPIIIKTIEVFYDFDPEIEIIIALPAQQIKVWEELTIQFHFSIPHKVVIGGKERFHSVQNALTLCSGEFIAIHDAVRPFISVNLIRRCFEGLKSHVAVVPVVELKDSIRVINYPNNKAVDRKLFRSVQTPQCFERTILMLAYEQEFKNAFTDDASVVEQTGCEIFLVEGLSENIKITTPMDLQFANFLISQIAITLG